MPVAIRSAVSARGVRHSTLVSSSVANASAALIRAFRASDTPDSLAGAGVSARLRLRRADAGGGGERVGEMTEVPDLRYRIRDAEPARSPVLGHVRRAEDAVDDGKAEVLVPRLRIDGVVPVVPLGRVDHPAQPREP